VLDNATSKKKYMKAKEVIGIDVSKEKLDVFIHRKGEHFVIDNSEEALNELLVGRKNAVVIFEPCGMYTEFIKLCCLTHSITYYEVAAVKIKRASGLARGKNDKVDAQRIAEYYVRFSDELTPSRPHSNIIERMGKVIGLRKRYVVKAAEIKGRLPQRKKFDKLGDEDLLIRIELETLKLYEQTIKELDKEIKALICSDEKLKTSYKLVTSIIGVGDVIAFNVIAETENFTRFTDPRKFACHVGNAPFEHSSGSSIRGGTKTSKLAKQSIKTILHQGAKSAIQNDPQLKKYYERKLAEGKKPKSTLNAVSFKLIARIFAVIERQKPYVKLEMMP
jgi:transposase